MPHPHGIKPWGNHYASNSQQLNTSGLGAFGVFKDELIVDLLAFVDIQTLCKLEQVSKVLLAFCSNECAWRDRYREDFSDLKYNAAGWKHSYSIRKGNDKEPSKKIDCSGVYSDYLYASWRCATVPVNLLSRNVETIERRSNLSVTDFKKEYSGLGHPVIITDVVQEWDAFSNWSIDTLIEKYSMQTFNAEGANVSLKDYVQYSRCQMDESPLYLFDNKFAQSGLGNDYSVPEYFFDDLFKILDKRPDYRWLIIGPERSGSTFHKDPNATSAWNAVIKGKKKWIMYPPSRVPPGVFTNAEESHVTSPISVAEWFINHYHADDFDGLECTVSAGEMIFIPAGWWHLVINLEESIAITQNFVNKENLAQVLTFLAEKPDQVSGYVGNLLADFTSKLAESDIEIPIREKKKQKVDFSSSKQFQFIF